MRVLGCKPLTEVSNTDLVHSTNGALEGLDSCVGHKVVSTRRLNNGGILLEMNSDAASGWINSPDNRASFLECFPLDATVKERAFSLVVQFVPLHFRLDKDREVRQVEEDNSLPVGVILHVRWIKLPHRRVLDQTCSHAIFVVSKPDTTNKILTHCLIVHQKHVYAEKCKKEPTRCLKCHGWGHLSYDCAQPFDMCGTCAGRHRMASCKEGVMFILKTYV